jgi:hypothetical protein
MLLGENHLRAAIARGCAVVHAATMGQNVELRCRCGNVRGRITDASRTAVTRVVCYCDDCQAYLHHLGRADLLDAHGGTDIVQVAPSSLTFHHGAEHIAGLRLSPKGLYRWYASCCKSPVGNSVTPAIPFVGIVAQAFDGGDSDRGGSAGDYFGPPRGAIMGKYAVGTPPEGSTKLNLPLIARAFRNILGWRLTGKTWPHPFFDRATRSPRYQVTVLSPAERDALRAHCGPRPTAASTHADRGRE